MPSLFLLFVTLVFLKFKLFTNLTGCHNLQTVKVKSKHHIISQVNNQITPAVLEITWPKAFIQGHYLQVIKEREALEAENLHRLQELAMVQQNLERDITTITTEYNTANNFVRSNKQESKDYVSQMQKYGALMVVSTAKTTTEYTEYLEGIQRHLRILVGYKRRHTSDKQASNLVYDRRV